jgi:UDP-N-acetylglucosamine 4-epimerase
MAVHIATVSRDLQAAPRTWLVTGAAGFIGSHLVANLLMLGQRVVGVDNFATGSQANLDAVTKDRLGFSFLEGDINDPELMRHACNGVDVVLHQAALGSVPRSLKDPIATHRANVDGFIVTLNAARDAGVKRFVYASSSSVYGDAPELPKVESRVGHPLSPYAATKAINEIYADVFGRCFGISCIGLRYFNVFGPRQDPSGPYAAVIPTWVSRLARGQRCHIFGDGETSRDFCYVDNAVQANLLAGVADEHAAGQSYNVACGTRTSLRVLHALICRQLMERAQDDTRRAQLASLEPLFERPRDGDVRHSLADITLARRNLGYDPTHDVVAGIRAALDWYLQNG